MSKHFAYFRVSTNSQSIESQRQAIGSNFDAEFIDSGISGSVMAKDRKCLSELMLVARAGDLVSCYAIDRLGRDSIDVQLTVKQLLEKGVELDIHGIGRIHGDIGKMIVALLAQVAEMERSKIRERTAAGRVAAKASFEATGMTHKGKTLLGRPKAANQVQVKAWRELNSASISQTAKQFKISEATVKNYCRTKLC
jgi:putative DNA-invertase from lambdoid prophage Rac